MKIENEITVLVTSTMEELHNKLINSGFSMKDKYITNDIYMINKDIDITKLSTLDILKKCAIVREITGIKKVLLYKHKEYNDSGDIIFNAKTECPIEDISKAVEFMKAINYQVLMEIHDKCTEYASSEIELIVQDVNNEYLFFEAEDELRYTNKKFSSIDEIKKTINKYDLPFKKDNYFVKKAEIILNKKLNRK
jgi:adenylate cyclase class IV